MNELPPLLDTRDAAALRAELVEGIKKRMPNWSPATAGGVPDQASAALIGIFARFGEVVIQRLNQAPNKNLLAFLDLLGVARNPPQPARVPLTFTLAPGSPADAVVPAGTQAAAPPREGESEPVIFETEREVTVVAATLKAAFSVDAASDMIADRTSLLETGASIAQRIFAGDRANAHILYLAHRDYFGYPQIKTLTVDVVVHGAGAGDPLELHWDAWNGSKWIELTPQDTTGGFHANGTVAFSNPVFGSTTIAGIENRWLRCRLATPITPRSTPTVGMARAAQLPFLDRIRVRAQLQRTALQPQTVIAVGAQVDATRPFAPFGNAPALGDAFYVGSDEVFAKAGAVVTIDFTIVNPITTPIFPDLQLKWQAWSGSDWITLGTSTTSNTGATTSFSDGTQAFTRSQTTSFTLPDTVAPTTIAGVNRFWLRVLISAGNYGVDLHYDPDSSAPSGFKVVLGTLRPPMIGGLSIAYQLTTPFAPVQEAIGFNNMNFERLSDALAKNVAVAPFRAFDDLPPALYAGFALPAARKSFPNRTLSIYQAPRPLQYGERSLPLHPDASIQTAAAGASVAHRFTLTNGSNETTQYDLVSVGGSWNRTVAPPQATLVPGASIEVTVTVTVPNAATLGTAPQFDRCFLRLSSPLRGAYHAVTIETRVGAVAPRQRRVRYEYWNGNAWSPLMAIDGSDRFARPGLLEFLGPSDFASSRLFDVEAYWIRALLDGGDDSIEPRLRALAANTTFATQTVTSQNEILGSSDASERQRYRTARNPVLSDQILQVREPGPLSDADVEQLLALVGPGAIVTASDERKAEFWVQWTEVADFYGSGPLDRHYLLDHVTGEVQFGNGIRGRIPPRGAGNIRLARYRTGGGDRGNRSAGTIVQLKTTIPYVERVFNPEDAVGGFAAESSASLIARAPRTLRHGGRAVAAEDYEDLTLLASPEIARAKCVPLRRLDEDPLGLTRSAGAVSVIVVPGDAVTKPLPTLELLARAENFLSRQQASTARVAVVGPLYVRVDVEVDVALASLEGASAVEQAVRFALEAFLHPLTGGRDGTGWDFGREPQRSDLYAVAGGVAGVDHVRQLKVTQVEEVVGVRATGRFLVYSGAHIVKLSFMDR